MVKYGSPNLTKVVKHIIAEIQPRIAVQKTPFLVALDGGSGSGKSTIATMLSSELNAALVQSDDFFAANIPDHEWDERTAAEKVRDCIDWQRLRKEALEPLLSRQTARWHPFDFEAGIQADGTYKMSIDYEERDPKDMIILDGAYATRPELIDLIDLSILIDVPVSVRHARLALREDAAFLKLWHQRWDAAEHYYFAQIRPANSFDVVIDNGE
ncbi:MAG: hypothetical protein AAF629_24315 [Chloroflexota bacterium]